VPPPRSLKQPEVVGTLLGYLTTEVADDAGDEIKYKLPYLAYEIFSCELTEIIDVVFDSPGLLASFMKVPHPHPHTGPPSLAAPLPLALLTAFD
jgi:hypothetical protein